MRKKKINLFLLVSVLMIAIFYYYQIVGNNGIQAIEGTNNPESFITEIDKLTGKILNGEQFDPDKPVIRPTYQGDFNNIFNDVIGPLGKFEGFYNGAAHNPGDRNTQSFQAGDKVIYKNMGRYQNRQLALMINFVGGYPWAHTVSVLETGALRISTSDKAPMYYQLVYDEENYPPVEDVYLELPNKINVGISNGTQVDPIPSIAMGSSNLIKAYLAIPTDWTTALKRSYTLTKDSKSLPANVEYFNMRLNSHVEGLSAPEFTVVSDNNEKTLLRGVPKTAINSASIILESNMKAPFTPFYLPVRANAVENSDTFEVKYDVGQVLTDTYQEYLPEFLKVIIDDEQGYFKNLDHDPIEFTDKMRNPIDLEIATEFFDGKIEITIPKETLKELKSNQVNMKLNFGTENLNIDKVLENYDVENDYYKVPLTFYNMRKLSNGEEKVSEKTIVDATINQGIYGDPIDTTVFLGSTSDDLDVAKLIKNSTTTIPGDSVSLEILERKSFTTEGIVQLPVKIKSVKNSVLTKIVDVPINVIKGDVITSEFFENQTWLIDTINAQFAPRKIDTDIYQSDLLAVKKVSVAYNPDKYRGQHIPTTIKALSKLEMLESHNLGLVGTLPAEIGELKNLNHIDVGGNDIEGTIPPSFTELLNLSFLSISDSKISGTIPVGFVDLPNLIDLFVNKTLLVGQIPTFSKVFNTSNFSDTQLTYNSAELPPFSGGISYRYDYSFLPTEKATLQLIGNKLVSSRTDTIKPFDPATPGYFDLAIQKPGSEGMEENSTKEALYQGHTYTIKDKKSGEVLYEGLAEETVEIAYRSKIEYQITLDEAFDNPANNVTIQGKLPELKFSATPEKIKLKTQVNNDSVDNNVLLDGQLAVFDNRGDDNHWKLKMTPSSLSDNQKQLQGEYVYTDLNGNEKIIVDNQAMLLEQGTSGDEEIFSISNQWRDGKGLKYRLKPGNLLGNYKGTVLWSLEDAP